MTKFSIGDVVELDPDHAPNHRFPAKGVEFGKHYTVIGYTPRSAMVAVNDGRGSRPSLFAERFRLVESREPVVTGFKPGDVLELDPNAEINSDIPKSWKLQPGERYTVRKVSTRYLYFEGPGLESSLDGFLKQRFRLVEEPETIQLDGPPRVPPHLEDVVVEPERRIVNRAYDFNRGDERKFDRAEAIELGRLRAIERGVRQQVRLSSPATIDGPPLWLIQDVL